MEEIATVPTSKTKNTDEKGFAKTVAEGLSYPRRRYVLTWAAGKVIGVMEDSFLGFCSWGMEEEGGCRFAG